jgi:hypothetical protein
MWWSKQRVEDKGDRDSLQRAMSMSYGQFRVVYPLARVLFEEPLFLGVAAGVRFLPNVERVLQQQLVDSGFEAALKATWIAHLSGQQVALAYHLPTSSWQVMSQASLENGEFDLTKSACFTEYPLAEELKKLIVLHHHLLLEIGMPLAKNSAKTILSVSAGSGFSVQEKKDRQKLSQELEGYTSDKVLLTSGGQWSTIVVDPQPMLQIRHALLQSIATLSHLPIELLEQSSQSGLFNGESDSSLRFQHTVRSLQQSLLYPIYSRCLPANTSWQLVDPFATSASQQLAHELAEQQLLAQKLANASAAQSLGIALHDL